MRKPVFLSDVEYIGKWYWCEIEGFENVARRKSGAMLFLEKEIMGWDVTTLDDIWKKQKEINYAPRLRLWESENESDKPTKEEREAGSWDNWSRLWLPNYRNMNKSREAEFLATGRTVWEKKEDAQ